MVKWFQLKAKKKHGNLSYLEISKSSKWTFAIYFVDLNDIDGLELAEIVIR